MTLALEGQADLAYPAGAHFVVQSGLEICRLERMGEAGTL